MTARKSSGFESSTTGRVRDRERRLREKNAAHLRVREDVAVGLRYRSLGLRRRARIGEWIAERSVDACRKLLTRRGEHVREPKRFLIENLVFDLARVDFARELGRDPRNLQVLCLCGVKLGERGTRNFDGVRIALALREREDRTTDHQKMQKP